MFVNPPGYCWGGALYEDPLHCYVLEQAQRDGMIEVEAVYRAGDSLFIYLAQTERVSDEAYQYIQDKGREEVLSSGGDACKFLDDRGCSPGVLEDNDGATILPQSKVYDDIVLNHGGSEARLSYPGWSSFVQLWPEVESSGESGTGDEFDVAEVDTTNFPDLKCGATGNSGSLSGACLWWERYPELGVAGINDKNSKTYLQVKAPPNGEVDVEAVRDFLVQRFRFADREDYIIIPVKYDFGELWRWSEVIDRFAYTSGNTLGITGSWVGLNWESYRGDAVFPLAELPEAGLDARDEYRTTIQVMTMHLDRTVAALPKLLGQLNIPVDAVGVVVETYRTPRNRLIFDVIDEPKDLDGGSTSESASGRPAPAGLGTGMDPNGAGGSRWLLVGGGGAAALLVLGSVALLATRLGRHRS